MPQRGHWEYTESQQLTSKVRRLETLRALCDPQEVAPEARPHEPDSAKETAVWLAGGPRSSTRPTPTESAAS